MLLDIFNWKSLDYPEMHVLEIEDEIMIKTCEMHDHRYTIITPNDIVIPPTILVIIFENIPEELSPRESTYTIKTE